MAPRVPEPRQMFTDAVIDFFLAGGQIDASLRTLAGAAGVSHSLLIYHFGTREGLLSAVRAECDRRQLAHLEALHHQSQDPVALLKVVWAHVAAEPMWPLYRLGFALRSLRPADGAPADADDRQRWIQALVPLVTAVGIPADEAADEALLWLSSCRGLLWELVSGADPLAIARAADRLAEHYAARTDVVGGPP